LRTVFWIIKDLDVFFLGDQARIVASTRDGIPKTAHHRESPAFGRVAAQLGRQLRERRQKRGWTVEEASERYGIEPAHVRRIEAGRTNPSLATLLSIADALSTDLAELFLEPVPKTKRGLAGT
jgi:DNA-binding XRE family transcriptional regulator